MKLTVEIPDNKADFMLELLKSLSFVKVRRELTKEDALITDSLAADMQDSITELNEVLAGRKKARSVYDFLNEIKAEDGIWCKDHFSFRETVQAVEEKYPSLSTDLLQLTKQLETDPNQGNALGKSCYKVRMSISSKKQGKSGGARVITFAKLVDETVFLLSIYDKAEQADLPPGDLDRLLAQLPDQ